MGCTHNCSSCGENCGSKNTEITKERLNEYSNVKKVIGVVSGKGGVGKSLVTSMLSVIMRRRENRVAILDADITGPSIPKAFGLKNKATGDQRGIIPATTGTGIEVMSINLLLPDETDPVLWRGPVIGGTVKQFWTDVIWEDVDYMFIDMPPGTGDVPLTVFQSIPVDGIVIVTSPQELVSMIVGKAVKMAQRMDVPIVGIIENYSYITCPDCGKKIEVFGKSNIDEVAKEYGINVVGKIPMDPSFANLCDKGAIELFEGDYLESAADAIESL